MLFLLLPAGHPLVVGVAVPGMCGLLCHELLRRFVFWMFLDLNSTTE